MKASKLTSSTVDRLSCFFSSSQTDHEFLKDVLKQMDPNKCIPKLWKQEDNYKSFKEEKEELWSFLNAFLKDKK